MLIHLTSGRGPKECELAVAKFLAALSQETEIEVLAKEEGSLAGCLKSALIRVDDMELCGTIQWICKSPYRPKHKRKNWFFGVNQIEETKDSVYEIAKGSGVVFQTFRAGGRGGQHVNKTESAVRAIHIATGLSAISSDQRSQHQNKKLALERLNELLQRCKEDEQVLGKKLMFLQHNSLVRGNPIRVYEGMGFCRK